MLNQINNINQLAAIRGLHNRAYMPIGYGFSGGLGGLGQISRAIKESQIKDEMQKDLDSYLKNWNKGNS